MACQCVLHSYLFDMDVRKSKNNGQLCVSPRNQQSDRGLYLLDVCVEVTHPRMSLTEHPSYIVRQNNRPSFTPIY